MFTLYDFWVFRRQLPNVSPMDNLHYLYQTLQYMRTDKGKAYGFNFTPDPPPEQVPELFRKNLTPQQKADKKRRQDEVRYKVLPGAQIYVMGKENRKAPHKLMKVDCCSPAFCSDRKVYYHQGGITFAMALRNMNRVCLIDNHYTDVLGFSQPDEAVQEDFIGLRRSLSGLQYLSPDEARESANKWRIEHPSDAFGFSQPEPVVLKDFIEYRRSLRGHQYSNLKQSKEIAKKWHIERSSDVSRRREIKTNFEQKLYCLFAEHIENKELITQPMITQLRGPDILPVAQNEEACENWLQEYYKSDVPPYVTSLFDEMLMKFTRKPDRWKLEGKMLNVGGYTLEGKNDFGSLSLS